MEILAIMAITGTAAALLARRAWRAFHSLDCDMGCKPGPAHCALCPARVTTPEQTMTRERGA